MPCVLSPSERFRKGRSLFAVSCFAALLTLCAWLPALAATPRLSVPDSAVVDVPFPATVSNAPDDLAWVYDTGRLSLSGGERGAAVFTPKREGRARIGVSSASAGFRAERYVTVRPPVQGGSSKNTSSDPAPKSGADDQVSGSQADRKPASPAAASPDSAKMAAAKNLLDKYRIELIAAGISDDFERQASKLEGAPADMGRAKTDRLAAISHEFFRDMAASGLNMQDLMTFKRAQMEANVRPGETALFPGRAYWERSYLAVERGMMMGRALIVQDVFRQTLIDAFNTHPDWIGVDKGRSPTIFGEMDIGSWVKMDLKSLDFKGDIDFSTIATTLEANKEFRSMFEERLRNRVANSQMSIDAVLTAHGAAGKEVFIGEWGKTFAELDMLKRSTWKVIKPVVIDGKVVNVSFEERPGKELFWETAMRTGTEVKLPEATAKMEPMISLEMYRHMVHDIARNPAFSGGDRLVKLLKYVQRSYAMNKDATQGSGWDPYSMNDPDLAALSEKVLKSKENPAALSEMMERLAGMPLTADNLPAFLDSVTRRCETAIAKNAEMGLAAHLRNIASMNESERQKSQEELWRNLGTEVGVFGDVEVPENIKRVRELERTVRMGPEYEGFDQAVESLRSLYAESFKLSPEHIDRLLPVDSWTKVREYCKSKLNWKNEQIERLVKNARQRFPKASAFYDGFTRFNEELMQTANGSALLKSSGWADQGISVYEAFMSGKTKTEALGKASWQISQLLLQAYDPSFGIPLAVVNSLMEGSPAPLAMAVGFYYFPFVGELYTLSTNLQRADTALRDRGFLDSMNSMLAVTEFDQNCRIVMFALKDPTGRYARDEEDVSPPGDRNRIADIFERPDSPFSAAPNFRYWRALVPDQTDYYSYVDKLHRLRRFFPQSDDIRYKAVLLENFRGAKAEGAEAKLPVDQYAALRQERLKKMETELRRSVWKAMADSLESACVSSDDSKVAEFKKKIAELENDLNVGDRHLGSGGGLQSQIDMEIRAATGMWSGFWQGDNPYAVALVYEKFIKTYSRIRDIQATIRRLWTSFGADLVKIEDMPMKGLLQGAKSAPLLNGQIDHDDAVATKCLQAHKRRALKIRSDLTKALCRPIELNSKKDAEHLRILAQTGFEWEHLRDDLPEGEGPPSEELMDQMRKRQKAYDDYLAMLASLCDLSIAGADTVDLGSTQTYAPQPPATRQDLVYAWEAGGVAGEGQTFDLTPDKAGPVKIVLTVKNRDSGAVLAETSRSVVVAGKNASKPRPTRILVQEEPYREAAGILSKFLGSLGLGGRTAPPEGSRGLAVRVVDQNGKDAPLGGLDLSVNAGALSVEGASGSSVRTSLSGRTLFLNYSPPSRLAGQQVTVSLAYGGGADTSGAWLPASARYSFRLPLAPDPAKVPGEDSAGQDKTDGLQSPLSPDGQTGGQTGVARTFPGDPGAVSGQGFSGQASESAGSGTGGKSGSGASTPKQDLVLKIQGPTSVSRLEDAVFTVVVPPPYDSRKDLVYSWSTRGKVVGYPSQETNTPTIHVQYRISQYESEAFEDNVSVLVSCKDLGFARVGLGELRVAVGGNPALSYSVPSGWKVNKGATGVSAYASEHHEPPCDSCRLGASGKVWAEWTNASMTVEEAKARLSNGAKLSWNGTFRKPTPKIETFGVGKGTAVLAVLPLEDLTKYGDCGFYSFCLGTQFQGFIILGNKAMSVKGSAKAGGNVGRLAATGALGNTEFYAWARARAAAYDQDARNILRSITANGPQTVGSIPATPYPPYPGGDGDAKAAKDQELSVVLSADKPNLAPGESAKISAKPAGGVAPYTYTWTGPVKGSGASVDAQAPASGDKLAVSVLIKDSKGASAKASLDIPVGGVKVVLVKKSPASSDVPAGGKASFSVSLTSGGKPVKASDYVLRWEPSTEVRFARKEAKGVTENTATFLRKGKTPVWVAALGSQGGALATAGESDRIEINVGGTDLALSASPAEPLVGQDVTITAKENPKLPDDEIAFFWDDSQGGAGTGPVANPRQWKITARQAKPITVNALLKGRAAGDQLAKASLTVTPKAYQVKAVSLGHAWGGQTTRPVVWKPGVGLVTLDKEISAFMDVGLRADVSPDPPAKETLRYKWTVNEGTTLSGNSSARETRAQRSSRGTIEATVEVRDAKKHLLGTGKVSVAVTVSDGDVKTGKSKAQELEKLRQEGARLWSEGDTDKACDTGQAMARIDPKAPEAKLWCEGRDKIHALAVKGREALDKGQLDQVQARIDEGKAVNPKAKELAALAEELKAAKEKGDKRDKERAAKVEELLTQAARKWTSGEAEAAEQAASEAVTLDSKSERAKSDQHRYADGLAKLKAGLAKARGLEAKGQTDQALAAVGEAKAVNDAYKPLLDLEKKLTEQKNAHAESVKRQDQARKHWEAGDLDTACAEAREAAKLDLAAKSLAEKYCQGRDDVAEAVRQGEAALTGNHIDKAEARLAEGRKINSKANPLSLLEEKIKAAKAKLEEGQARARTDAERKRRTDLIASGAGDCSGQRWESCRDKLAAALNGSEQVFGKQDAALVAKASELKAKADQKLKEKREAGSAKAQCDKDFKRADAALKAGDFALARDLYLRGAKTCNNCAAYYNAGLAMAKLQDYAGAKRAFATGGRCAPNDPDYGKKVAEMERLMTQNSAKAQCDKDFKRADAALKASDFALARDLYLRGAKACNNCAAYYNAGLAMAKLQDYAGAKRAFATGGRCAPNDPDYGKKVAEMERLMTQGSAKAQCDKDFKRADAALKASDFALARDLYLRGAKACNNCAAYYNAGLAMAKLQDYAGAKRAFATGGRCAPNDPDYGKKVAEMERLMTHKHTVASAAPGGGFDGAYVGRFVGQSQGEMTLNIRQGRVTGTVRNRMLSGQLTGSVDAQGRIKCQLNGSIKVLSKPSKMTGSITGQVRGGHISGDWVASALGTERGTFNVSRR